LYTILETVLGSKVQPSGFWVQGSGDKGQNSEVGSGNAEVGKLTGRSRSAAALTPET